MKRYVTLLIILTIGWAASALGIQSVHAAPNVTYELVQSSIGPGGSGSAGSYDLSSSIGQPAAGEVSAGIYTLGGGFWGGGVIVPVASHYYVFLPLVRR
jgi:hypothetical protein